MLPYLLLLLLHLAPRLTILLETLSTSSQLPVTFGQCLSPSAEELRMQREQCWQKQ
jgi:hypothetical protein